MPRKVTIIIPSESGAALVAEVAEQRGVLAVQVAPGGMVKPPGDVIDVLLLTSHLHELLETLRRHGVGVDSGTLVITNEPDGVVDPSVGESIYDDVNEASWEEVELSISKEGGMRTNQLMLMALAGATATVGIASGAIHLVVGAMIIAPGFEPLARIALGWAAGGGGHRTGLRDTLRGYLALMAGAGLMTLLLLGAGLPLLTGETGYVPGKLLVQYWSTFTPASTAASAVAAVAGGFVLMANRSVLTAGVMIALALIPSASLAVMATLVGQFETAMIAGLRWLVDAALVVSLGYAVFAWKRRAVQRHPRLG